ncbi:MULTISPECIES: type 2 lanthipeptide synthetase LanM family protein [Halomicrobium]|uniref:Lanthionine synthetase C family protein n=2 Tax=Halomicrobium mukohataei TaxID=57705 RepID=C7P006_HALMD|nr:MULTISPECIES: type 2 lanthipeptide synthetase LanM family protein [Halomicrobium]ACV46914.1 Lanthionine synthetase C family protein [Halomicrobium mukohataei DSM 12286]QCD65413.1 type 2 lantipeptide synthetase LanM [Halomicrobium mukohataei]QFR20219.1 type 2 lantipeptide synthetase LanM [Halomicrobium sp. ZPS1]
MTAVFTDAEKRSIVGQARTLHERVQTLDEYDQDVEHDERIEALWDEWRSQFPSDGSFEDRIEWSDVSESEWRRAIEVETLNEGASVPAWVDRLEAAVAAIQDRSPERADTRFDVDTDERRLLGELTAALADYVCDRVPAEVEEALTDQAIAEMGEWFRTRFQNRFSRILFVEFKSFVAAHDRELAFADPNDFDEPPSEYYDRFVAYLFDGGFVDLCQEYPVFARLLVTQIRQWQRHLDVFCERLRSDRDLLCDRFGSGDDLGPVVSVKPLADDTHGDGRAVMRVTFDAGLSVVYKPRSVAAGEALYDTLEAIDEHLSCPSFDTPTYLDRDAYGWMEWIDHEPCQDDSEVERYYRRAGVWLCLAHLFEFSDCHFENVKAAGDQPLLVDSETVFHPYFDAERRPGSGDIGTLTDDSTLLTSLLPYDVTSAHDTDAKQSRMRERIAGFGERSGEVTLDGIQVPQIVAENTDVMSVEDEPATLDRDETIPVVDGDDHPPDAYIEVLVDGFREAYETVLDLRDSGALEESIAVFDRFEGLRNRLVYRPTMEYAKVLRDLTSRDCLGDGVRFGVELEQLSTPFFDGSITDRKPWALYEAERTALRRLDPPRFTSRTDEHEIEWGGTGLGITASQTGFERARERIERADRSELRKQLEIIRGCYGEPPQGEVHADVSGTSPQRPSNDDAFLRESKRLLRTVRSSARETADGHYQWASIAPYHETDRLTIQPAGGSLYVGGVGIGLLGAALFAVDGDSRYAEFARSAVGPIRDAVRTQREVPAFENLGGALGVGSVAYGLSVIGTMIDDREMLEDATRVANRFPEARIAEDETYDAVGGSAGTILGLLGAYNRIESPELLSLAEACGDRLLDARQTLDGVGVWKTVPDCPPLTGMAHGVSGIAYALVRLWDATGNQSYLDAATEALAYERDAYVPEADNWIDYRPWTDRHPDQWCYGRSGIGLARLGMADYLTDPSIERDIERATSGLSDVQTTTVDHLCCGSAGRAAFLLALQRRRQRHEGAARRTLGDVLGSRRANGHYRTLSETAEIVDPTFFQGVSGIGYAYLRLCDPDELPCILLWE